MSKKVALYLVLDLMVIGITLIIRGLLCNVFLGISDMWLQNALAISINIICVIICLFIIFFFLLYWWSDRKWTSIKRKLSKK